MANEHLTAFVAAAKAKGISDDSIAALLLRRGWSRNDVFGALAAYWEDATGLAIPHHGGHGESARDGFLYLLAFLTLAVWTSALGSMWFHFIDYWFPDPLPSTNWPDLRLTVTWQLASSAVAFPIFALVMRTILNEATQSPERLESGVRRWLTYIALLLTAGGVVSDLIFFLNSFLEGGLTVRFVLKIATVLIICGAIFMYYLWSLRWTRQEELQRANRQSFIVGISTLAVLALSFFIGLGIAGTPSVQRKIEADNRRVEGLRQLAADIFAWRQTRQFSGMEHNQAPLRLSDVIGVGNQRGLDPYTKQPYEYSPGFGTAYRLCAVFTTSNADERAGGVFWKHQAGRSCYNLDAAQNPPWQ